MNDMLTTIDNWAIDTLTNRMIVLVLTRPRTGVLGSLLELCEYCVCVCVCCVCVRHKTCHEMLADGGFGEYDRHQLT